MVVAPTPPRTPRMIDQLAGAGRLRSGRSREHVVADAGDQIGNQRLEEIFGDAGEFQIAVEHDVVTLADHDDAGIRLADLGKLIDPHHGIGDVADVHDQEPRRGLLGERRNGSFDVAMDNSPHPAHSKC